MYVGRGVAALAADPDVRRHSGDILSSWELARIYGVADVDGRRPDWGAHFARILPETGLMASTLRYVAFLDRLHRRAARYTTREECTDGVTS